MKNFIQDESGAVTVDWVVLTAGVVGLAIAVVAAITPGAVSLGDQIGNAVSVAPIGGGE